MGVAARGTGAVVGDRRVLEWTDGWGSRGRPGCWLGRLLETQIELL